MPNANTKPKPAGLRVHCRTDELQRQPAPCRHARYWSFQAGIFDLKRKNSPVESIDGDYACRWRMENVISEAVNFFNLNALSSPILTKVYFDVIMTMVTGTLYSMLAGKTRGLEH
jgi:hypothetical protein